MLEWLMVSSLWIWALVVTWPFLVMFSLLVFWTCGEDEPRFFAFFSNILLTAIIVAYYDIGWDVYRWYFIAYLPMGVLWSFYRFDRHAKFIVEESKTRPFKSLYWYKTRAEYPKPVKEADSPMLAKDDPARLLTAEERKQYQAEELALDQNVGRITHWILSWPISIVCWGLRDIIEAVKDFITVRARKVYEAIAGRYIEK